jgi:hypothetical protein
MPKWMYKKEKDEIISKLFEDDDKIPSGWKESPQEAGKKAPKKK